jgi:hypothetical protein
MQHVPNSHHDNGDELHMNNLHSLKLAIIDLREIKKATGRIQRFIPQCEMKSSGLRIVGLTCGSSSKSVLAEPARQA